MTWIEKAANFNCYLSQRGLRLGAPDPLALKYDSPRQALVEFGGRGQIRVDQIIILQNFLKSPGLETGEKADILQVLASSSDKITQIISTADRPEIWQPLPFILSDLFVSPVFKEKFYDRLEYYSRFIQTEEDGIKVPWIISEHMFFSISPGNPVYELIKFSDREWLSDAYPGQVGAFLAEMLEELEFHNFYVNLGFFKIGKNEREWLGVSFERRALVKVVDDSRSYFIEGTCKPPKTFVILSNYQKAELKALAD